MLSRKVFSVIVVLFLVATPACQTKDKRPVETPVPEVEAQGTPTVEIPTTEPVDLQATADAQSTVEALSTANAQATADAQATATVVAEATQQALDSQATATQAMVIKQTATAEVVQQATAQAQSMVDRIQTLYDEGIVGSTEGTYVRLEDFDESWAQINWFQWWNTGYEPENFAIRTDVAWSSASDKANWFNSGCGFIFGQTDKKNFHVSHLVLDGFVTLKYWRNGDGNWIAKRPAENITTPAGEAEVLMVVYDKRVTFYVNGTEALNEYAGIYKPGSLALTLSSGTNMGYGTRCQMSDVDLWIFE